jgi:IS30 family transposase
MWLKKELIDRRSQFWAVLARGATLQAACDAVGVNRRTGRRWRQATGGRIPRKVAPSSGRHLSLAERLQIAELRRNGPSPGVRAGGKYLPYAAQKRSELRGRRPKASKFDNPGLASVVQTKLCRKWSPEQNSLHLAAQFGDRAEMRVAHETIYQALFVQGRRHLRADLHQHLRTGRAVRRPRGSTVKRRGAPTRPGRPLTHTTNTAVS